MYATHGDVRRQQGMNYPERRAQQCDILDEDTLTLIEVNHLRTQSVGGAEATLIHRHTVLGILQQSCPCSHILSDATLFHTKLLAATPWPPRVVRTTTVDGALTCNGDVTRLIGINERREVPAIKTFPARRHYGVKLGLEGELQYSTLLNNEVDTTLQLNGSRKKPLTGRHDDASATFLRAFVDGLLYRLLVLCGSIVGLCAILGYHIRLVGKLRQTDALLNLFVLLVVPALSLYSNSHNGEKHHDL